MKKRLLALLLCAAIGTLLLPAYVFAEDSVETFFANEDSADDGLRIELADGAVETEFTSGIYDTVPWKIMKITSGESEEYKLLEMVAFWLMKREKIVIFSSLSKKSFKEVISP